MAEQIVKVQGVLEYNDDTRNEMLRRNYGKYSQYKDLLPVPIGSNVEIRDLQAGSLTDGDSLLDYTHDGKNEYSSEINNTNFINISRLKKVYSLKPVFKQRMMRWNGEYADYLDYVDHVYGKPIPIYDTFRDILSATHMQYNMDNLSVGTVMPHVNESLNGVVVTNVNRRWGNIDPLNLVSSLGGTVEELTHLAEGNDTKLGLIGNDQYSRHLYFASHVNTLRNRGMVEDLTASNSLSELFRLNKGKTSFCYITPKLYFRYGNNNSNVAKLYNLFSIDPKTGRIPDVSPDNYGINRHVSKPQGDNWYPEENLGNYQVVYLKDCLDAAAKELSKYGKNPDNRYYPWMTAYESDWHNPRYARLVDDKVGISANKDGVVFWQKDDKVEDGYIDNVDGPNNAYSDTRKDFLWYDRQAEINTQNDNFDNQRRLVYDERQVPKGYEDNTVPFKFESSLLNKTAKMFRSHLIKTMVGRFCDYNEVEGSDVDYAARTSAYGHSHGRNLLTKKKQDSFAIEKDFNYINGYENPYCRVWTYHHQYDSINKLIRPFTDDQGNVVSLADVHDKRMRVARFGDSGSGENGASYLSRNSVLEDTGFVHITPNIDDKEGRDMTKKYMFSIENLAWKDVLKTNPKNIHPEQIGPNGGRIMWFPPYDLKFEESVSVNWNSNSFIGRGEKTYTYTDTERRGTVSFSLLVDHPSIVDTIAKNDDVKISSDSDFLRFFAGCSIWKPEEIGDPYDSEERLYEGNDGDKKPDSEDPEVKPNDDPEKGLEPNEGENYICVRVYFPNNYSGRRFSSAKNVSRQVFKIEKDEEKKVDSDWWQYLIGGQDTFYPPKFPDELGPNGGRGYEMSPNSGITTTMVFKPGEENVKEDKDYSYLVDKHNTPGKRWTIYHDHSDIVETSGGTKQSYYRMDADLMQGAIDADSERGRFGYYDTQSYQLNYKVEGEPDDTYSLYEFCSVFMDGKGFKENNNVSKLNPESERMKRLIQIKKDIEGGTVTRVRSFGIATKQDEVHTPTLSRRRAMSLCDLIIREAGLTPKDNNNENAMVVDLSDPTQYAKYGQGIVIQAGNEHDNNTESVKKSRMAYAYIYYNPPKISLESDNASDFDKVDPTNDESIKNAKKKEEEKAKYTVRKSTVTRYENEGEYFERIKVDDPILYKNIREKFRHFSPAFHSITPEGFNARLTFIHQCTRQGHTISKTDGTWSATAGNMSFGRMPVCVLRIGDFIHTRCIIDSVSITYDNGGTQWDLNPEGIGVQPMYANVRLGIVILGGESLEGPISRLQNALTFDYYANTGVYDNRSDMVSISEGGNRVVYKNLFVPDETTNK